MKIEKQDKGVTNANLVNKYNIKMTEFNDNSLAKKDLKQRLAVKFPSQITHKDSYSVTRPGVCITRTE